MAKYEFNSKQFIASDVVDKRISDYAVDVAIHKLPHIVDGLKVIHRRILWTMYKYKMFNDKTLLNSIMGKIIEIHPVGDQSINDACTRLTQDFSMGMRLLKARGNSGSYGMAKAGAPRYLHAGIDDLAREIFFDDINEKTIPLILGEDCISLEPAYLIPRLPTSLLIHSFTVGVGIKSNVLPLYFDNVCELVKRFADNRLNHTGMINPDYSKLSRLFIPDIPISNTIKNVDELLDAYTRGEYNKTLHVNSDVDIYKNSINIKTVPFGQSFSDMIENVKLLAKDKKSWMYDTLTGYHNGQNDKNIGNLELTFKNNKDIFDIFRKLSTTINYNSSLTPIFNYISKRNNVIEMTPPVLLATWYEERRASILGGIKYDQESESRLLREKQVKLKVRDHTDEIIDIIRNKSTTTEEALEKLQAKFDLSYNQATILYNTRIGNLNKQSASEIEEDIKRHTNRLIELKNKSTNADEVIFKDAEYFQKKYKKPRVSKITGYDGYVSINGTDIIQWDNTYSAYKLLSEFPNAKVYTYPEKFNYKTIYPNPYRNKDYIDLPKITQGSCIVAYPSNSYYTLWIHTKTNKPVCTEGNNSDTGVEKDRIYIPVTYQFDGIAPNGDILKCKVSDLLVKKSTNRSKSEYQLIYGVPRYNQGIALLYMNDTEPEKIQIAKITNDTKRILISPIGKTEFIGFIPLHSTNEYLFTLPDFVKGSYKYISIKDIDSIIDNSTSSTSILLGRKVKRNNICKELVEL